MAEEVRQRLDLNRTVFMPCADPPHKEYEGMAPAPARFDMVDLAIADNPHFEISSIELNRGGKSYTVDTLRQIREDLGYEVEIYLIVGSDNVPEIPKWYRPERIFDLCTVVVASRPGAMTEGVDARLVKRMRFIPIPLIQISSTDIRRRLRENESVRYMVPPQVARYIREKGLYVR